MKHTAPEELSAKERRNSAHLCIQITYTSHRTSRIPETGSQREPAGRTQRRESDRHRVSQQRSWMQRDNEAAFSKCKKKNLEFYIHTNCHSN